MSIKVVVAEHRALEIVRNYWSLCKSLAVNKQVWSRRDSLSRGETVLVVLVDGKNFGRQKENLVAEQELWLVKVKFDSCAKLLVAV